MINRSEINTALAKALAYANCGKFQEAQRWGAKLVLLLEDANVFPEGSYFTLAGSLPNFNPAERGDK